MLYWCWVYWVYYVYTQRNTLVYSQLFAWWRGLTDARKISLVSTARVLVGMRQSLPRIVVIVYFCKLFGHSPVYSCNLIRVTFIRFSLWLTVGCKLSIVHFQWRSQKYLSTEASVFARREKFCSLIIHNWRHFTRAARAADHFVRGSRGRSFPLTRNYG